MNLPHLEPLIFAKKITEIDENIATVLCDFGKTPSLSMFIEASAQASSAFSNSISHKKEIGFLTMAKNIELVSPILNSLFLIKVKKENMISNIKQFSFEAFDKDTNCKVIIGSFTLVIPNENA